MARSRPTAIGLLLADVDGTLVTRDKVLTPRAQQAVHELANHRIQFALTSGRPPKGMSMLIEPLRIVTPVAGFNGGVFVTPDMTVIETRTIDPAAAKKAADLIGRQGLDVWLYTGDEWLVRDRDAPHREREESTVRFPPKVVGGYTDADFQNTVKIVGVSDDLDKVAACEIAVQRALGNTVSAARSQPYYLDVTNPRANKGAVVGFLASALGIEASAIATIGDMPNDVLMFKPSGYAIAMGNASQAAQEEADVVTESCDDDGFAKAVERYILQ